jgi:hypothetical protein
MRSIRANASGREEARHSTRSPGGPDAGIEGIIASDDNLTTARNLYRAAAADNPGRVVLLCQGDRIVARSDRELKAA